MDAHKFTFKGVVYRRSSARPPKQPDVPGEAAVFSCNPKRSQQIMEATGWDRVFSGTLNLCVAEDVFERLCGLTELMFEQPQSVTHPTNPQIPSIRGGYYYYRAEMFVRGETEEVLVRRAGNPHDRRCVELVASVGLMQRFQIDQGSEVEIVIA